LPDVRFAPIAINFRGKRKCRDVPETAIGQTHSIISSVREQR
jgi:hypothetical protein